MDDGELPELIEDVEDVEDVEVVEIVEGDGLPVIAEVRSVESARPATGGGRGAVQAAAAAATGFVAGAATLALARRYGARRVARLGRDVVGGGLGRRPGDFWPAPGTTRTYVVRVRMLTRPAPPGE